MRHRIQVLAFLMLSLLVTSAMVAESLNPGSGSPLIIPAAAFSADGGDSANTFNTGGYIRGGPGVRAYAPVYLPPNARITQVQMMARDSTDSLNISAYLKEVAFGTAGPPTTLHTLQTAGNSTSFQWAYDFVDADTDSTNNIYYLEAVMGSVDLRIYQVRVFFERIDLFSDGFESGDTSAWSAALPLAEIPDDATSPVEKPEVEHLRLVDVAPQIWSNDSQYLNALEHSINQTAGFGSPVVLPAPAFKSDGQTASDYYISNPYGYLYTRPDEVAFFTAPVNLPQGATISHMLIDYLDSNPNAGGKLRVWLIRTSTTTSNSEDLGYFESSGVSPNIRRHTILGTDLVDAVIDNFLYTYHVTAYVERTEWSEDYFNRFYSVAFLYTDP